MKSLLVPVDFSDNARDALRYALAIASYCEYRIDCLHVTKISTRTHYLSTQQIGELEQQARLEAVKKLEAFIGEVVGTLAPGTTVRPVVRIGFAIEEIIAQCLDDSYHAIVMGTKGVTNLRDKVLGTNTANVVENVPIPVLTVPHGAQFRPVEHLTYVCNVEAVNLPAMGRLVTFAGALGATLMLLHVDTAQEYSRQGASQAMEQLVARALNAEKLSVKVWAADSVVAGIAAFLQTDQDGLLAISLRDRGVFRKVFLTSVDDTMRARMNVPILTLHA
ncbi:MAG: universal stress protein [Bacteroidia bacterium]|nr:universal stress protein [Bacteroidia bacterium]